MESIVTNAYQRHQCQALFNWLFEVNMFPEIVVYAQTPGVDIPEHLKVNPFVTLNLDSSASVNLSFNDTDITFASRFNRISRNCRIPYAAVAGFTSRSFVERVVIPIMPLHGVETALPAGATKVEVEQPNHAAEPEQVTKSTAAPALKVVATAKPDGFEDPNVLSISAFRNKKHK